MSIRNNNSRKNSSRNRYSNGDARAFLRGKNSKREEKASRKLSFPGLVSGRLLKRGLFLVLGVALGFGLFRLPVFYISKVEVTGIPSARAQEVTQLLPVQGQNLLTLNTDAIKSSLTKLPWVKAVEIQRRPWTLDVKMEERAPQALWRSAGVFYLVDDAGIVIASANPNDQSSLAVIQDTDSKSISLGGQVDKEAISLALAIKDRLPKELGIESKAFSYSSRTGLTVETNKSPSRLIIGDGRDLEFKLAVWGAALKGAEEGSIKGELVDLRYGLRPYIR